VLLGLPEFEFLNAGSIEETCSLLSEHGAEARILAGGTDLLIVMKHKRVVPRVLVNIKRIPHLDGIHFEDGDGVRIGALATVQSLQDSSRMAKDFKGINQAAGVLGTTQIRNIGTLGGNLANASPSAEFGPVLLTLGASLACVGPGGDREIPIGEFFLAPGESALEADEMLTEIRVPGLPAGAKSIYLKHSLRRMDVAVASAAVYLEMDEDRCTDARIALGAVAPTPFRAAEAEALLRGRKIGEGIEKDELFDEVAEAARGESTPIDDFRGYAGYRLKVTRLLVRQALDQVTERAAR
jgi:carbon-monoxide dehydrogenase medium subunit